MKQNTLLPITRHDSVGCVLTASCDMGGPAGLSPLPVPALTPSPASTAAAPGNTSIQTATFTVRRTGVISPAALAYLTYAVDYIQQNVLNSDQVDWPAVRARLRIRANGPDDRRYHPAIECIARSIARKTTIPPCPNARSSTARKFGVLSEIGLTAKLCLRKVTGVDARAWRVMPVFTHGI